MADFHGVQVRDVEASSQPIATVNTSVIGAVGIAPEASDADYPLNTPVLVRNAQDAAGLGVTGELAEGVRAMYTQGVNPLVVVVRVADDVDADAKRANIIGTTTADGDRTGVQALLDADSNLGVTPRLVCVPGAYGDKSVADAMIAYAERKSGIAVLDGPNTTDAAVQTYRNQFSSRRGYLIDPASVVFDPAAAGEITISSSAIACAMIAKNDADPSRGFWYSPSNMAVFGVSHLSRAIDYDHDDASSRAQLLDNSQIATIINNQGYRLWGNKTLSSDASWLFLPVVRTRDVLHKSLVEAHQSAIDKGITTQYIDYITTSVQNFLDDLVGRGAILGGTCWYDDTKNSKNAIKQGEIRFTFDFTPVYPAEKIVFESMLTDSYLSGIAA